MADEHHNTIEINVGELCFSFGNKVQWITYGADIWREHNLRHEDALCVDAKNRICQMGKHFARAEEDGSYPIRVYRKQTAEAS